MRTISIRLDDRTDTLLRLFCERLGLSQTDALKAAIEHLAEQQRPTPADLAAQLGLIGSFRSGQGDLAARHSTEVKQRLRAKLRRDSVAAPPARARAAATRRKAGAA